MAVAVVALEDAYTDAHLFKTICQIRRGELDDAGTHELVHHIRGTARPLAPSHVASSSSSLFGISGSPLSYPPHLAPRCCVPIRITSLSRVGFVKLVCAVMDPSAPLQSFASPKVCPVHRPTVVHAFVLCFACCHECRRDGGRLH
jgi:hypothetical protein